MQKWNCATQQYEPYEVPKDWVTPLVIHPDDLDMEINCASCGTPIVAGYGYTSRLIHNDYGLGYSVCEDCYMVERAMEMGR